MTIELARRGYTVDGLDSSEVMVERARRGAFEAEVGEKVNLFRGDGHSLLLSG